MTETILGALAEVASRGRGALLFHEQAGSAVRLSADDLLEEGRRLAAVLAARGAGPGDTVGLLGPNHSAWARWAFGIWTAGAAVAPIQFPLRVRDRSALAEQIGTLIRGFRFSLVVTVPTLADVVPAGLCLPWDGQRPGTNDAFAQDARPEDPAVIQFTSGTTAAPKAAVITHGAVVSAIRATAVAYGITSEDVYAGWQPFFHDLGLFGLLLRPLLLGLEAHYISTEWFARDPAEWFRLAGRSGATMLAGPSSAWAAAARASARAPAGCDLGSVRAATFSAEMVDPHTVEDLEAAGRPLGLRPTALSAAYGMAETTLAVTVTRPGERLRFDRIDPGGLAASGRARRAKDGPARRVASCGVPVPGAEVRIVDEQGVVLPERTVGRILARAPYLFSGYLGGGEEDPAFEGEGWLRTGDLGYMAEGELFYTGREKDVIVVLGRNVDPDDIEWAAGRVPGVRTGRCVALPTPNASEGAVTVVVEPREGTNAGTLPALVRSAVSDAIGLTPAEVLVVRAGTVLKTTSGKLRRGALRQALAEGSLQVTGRWLRSR